MYCQYSIVSTYAKPRLLLARSVLMPYPGNVYQGLHQKYTKTISNIKDIRVKNLGSRANLLIVFINTSPNRK